MSIFPDTGGPSSVNLNTDEVSGEVFPENSNFGGNTSDTELFDISSAHDYLQLDASDLSDNEVASDNNEVESDDSSEDESEQTESDDDTHPSIPIGPLISLKEALSANPPKPQSKKSQITDSEVHKKKRRKRRDAHPPRKTMLGGEPECSPSSDVYWLEDDPLEPECSPSSDEEWGLYAVRKPSHRKPLFPLALWSSRHVQKLTILPRLIAEPTKANMKRLRRRMVRSDKEYKRIDLETKRVIRVPNPVAYEYNNWVRREHKFLDQPHIEIYEKKHLLNLPDHHLGFRVCQGFFDAGLTLPLPELTISILNFIKKAPCQLTAIAYAQIALVIAIGEKLDTEITLEEFFSVFSVQLAAKGDAMTEQMFSGHPVYCFTRKPRQGYFTPPSKLSYINSQVYEVYGRVYPLVGGETYSLQYTIPNDYEIKHTLGKGRDPEVISQIGELSLEARRKAFPKHSKWFPDDLFIAENAYKKNEPYKNPKQLRKEEAEKLRRAGTKRKSTGDKMVAEASSKLMASVIKRGKKRSSTQQSEGSAPKQQKLLPNATLQKQAAQTIDASNASLQVSENQPRNSQVSEAPRLPSPSVSDVMEIPPEEIGTILHPFVHDWKKLERHQTSTNRALREETAADPEARHNPDLIDGEAYPLNKKTLTIHDPMTAAVYASIPTPADKDYFQRVLTKGGASLCLQEKMVDHARAIARDVAMIEYVAKCEDKLKRLQKREKNMLSPEAAAEMKAKNVSLEKRVAALEKKEKECDAVFLKSNELEHKLKLSEEALQQLKQIHATLISDMEDEKKRKDAAITELTAMKTQQETATASAQESVNNSQALVNRYEACVIEHKKTCPAMADLFVEYVLKPVDEFLPGTYKPDFETESDDEEINPDSAGIEGNAGDAEVVPSQLSGEGNIVPEEQHTVNTAPDVSQLAS